MPGRNIIVIGGSAGGLESVRRLVEDLPPNLPAAVFVALHIAPYSRSHLPEILSRRGQLPAIHPCDHEPIRPQTIYVAPPDMHLLVARDRVRVVQGPKEHNVRPAVDPLFRTAAVSHGPRVIGVVLSGLLDDGTAGLHAIKKCGGIAIVQDPSDALYPDMPAHALQDVAIDCTLPAAELGEALTRLATEPLREAQAAFAVPDDLKFEAAMAEWDEEALEGHDRPGKPSPFVCPSCKGDLWEQEDGTHVRYRCRTGHAWSSLSLLAGQAKALDDSLNEAFRALKEKMHLSQRLATQARRMGNRDGANHYDRETKDLDRSARLIWELLMQAKHVNPQEPDSDVAFEGQGA